jgi:methionyl-tRNA formyltransferase
MNRPGASAAAPTRAVVFAYHNVGVRCLLLLAHGVNVPLVVTHRDNPQENIWFESVAQLAAKRHLPCAMPDNPNERTWLERLRSMQPDLIFSFYYRHMLDTALLDTARLGAYNMHGSLLPKYRGRAPVNWAVIRGERETGATLHRMVAKPDAGAMVAQQAVPILPDDTAAEVFDKVTAAAEVILHAALPSLINGSARETELDLSAGSYFGGRTPEAGRIDWRQSAPEIHNLIRGVAPPYPGAFFEVEGKRFRVLRSRLEPLNGKLRSVALRADGERLLVECLDGNALELPQVEYNGHLIRGSELKSIFGAERVELVR